MKIDISKFRTHHLSSLSPPIKCFHSNHKFLNLHFSWLHFRENLLPHIKKKLKSTSYVILKQILKTRKKEMDWNNVF